MSHAPRASRRPPRLPSARRASAGLPLQVRDELADGDLLGHLLVEVVAVEHHGLQDGQGPLQDGGVHARLVHETRYLETQAGHG